MDPSKLPHNPQPPHVPHHPSQKELETPPKTSVAHYGAPLPGGFIPAEFWLSLCFGLIILFMFPEFRDYLINLHHPDIFYSKYTIVDASGMSLAFEKSAFFFREMGLTYFGIVLILDALVLLRPTWSLLVWATLAVTVSSVLLNIYAIIQSNDTAGFAWQNALCVAFGGYLALYQWRLLQLMRLS
jgi:hypothetical protein